MSIFFIEDDHLQRALHPPGDHAQLASNPQRLLPPMISDLHASFRAWGDAGLSPGPVTAERIWVSSRGHIAVEFQGKRRPVPLLQVGAAPDLAAWLVLLDCYMETYVVVARARATWTVGQLAGALCFMNAAYLPPPLTAMPAADWTRTATAVAAAVADGPLAGTPQNRHWTQ